MSVLDEICRYAEKKLSGTGLTFAVVAWLDGRADDPKAVALSGPPKSHADAPTALRTAADAADPPAEAWTAFAKGKCRVCGDFRRVDAANVCLPCATDGAADDRGDGQADG